MKGLSDIVGDFMQKGFIYDRIVTINSYNIVKTLEEIPEVPYEHEFLPFMHKVIIFKKVYTNVLMIQEVLYYFLVIKKKWQGHFSWIPEDSKKFAKTRGLTFPQTLYNIILNTKNKLNHLVVYLQKEDLFYDTEFSNVVKFMLKHGTYFQDDYDTFVFGMPHDIFKVI